MKKKFEPNSNFEIASQFLRLLDDKAETFCFQTFPEKDKDGKSSNARPFCDHLPPDAFERLQFQNEKKAGISVAVNETDGEGRGIDNIKRVRAVWQDDDKGFGDKNYPLPPSVVIQSSPGRYHRYWLVEEDWPADERGREDFERAMVGMQKYGCDPQACDISKVMRLPGTYNRKNGQRQLVEIVFPAPGQEARRYTREQIVNAFGADIESRTIPVVDSSVDAGPVDLERIRSALAFISSDDPRCDWINVGMAIHHATEGNEDGFRVWDDWSKGSGKYDPKEIRRQWKSFRLDHARPVTVAMIFRMAKENGWTGDHHANVPLPPLPEEKIEIERWTGDLADRAIQSVRAFLADGGKSNPSDLHYQGMEEIAKVIQAMAEGNTNLETDFLVSFLPTGIGKTTTIRESIRELVRTPAYERVGVIVFLSRVEEIAKLVEAMGLTDHQYAILVSPNYQDKVPLGNRNPDAAQVLFTTQQMLEAYLKGSSTFEAIREFRFNGKPRQVRIWDEAILPSNSLTVGQWDITNLYKGLSGAGHSELVTELMSLFDNLKETKDRDIIEMPDIDRFNIGMEEARSLFSADDDKNAIEALWKLSGRTVRVRRDNKGNAALDYEDVFPDDMGPLLVCDASGHLRQVYRFWYSDRKGLRFLFSPGKSYSGLTVHHWNRGSGKRQYKRDNRERRELYEGIVRTIEAIPAGENILIVHFRKNAFTADIEKELADALHEALGADFFWRDRIRFCTWGKHTATNEFADCKHVILASVLQYSVPQNEAHGRGARKLGTEDDFPESDFIGTRLGEIRHNIFQAACRGAVRRAEGNSCPAGCHLYIVYSTTGIPRSILSDIFPEAMIEDWKPILRLRGKKQQLADYLSGLATAEGTTMPKSDLSTYLGIKKNHLIEVLDQQVIEYLRAERNIMIDKDHHHVTIKGPPAAKVNGTTGNAENLIEVF
jgi:hypothetical protein